MRRVAKPSRESRVEPGDGSGFAHWARPLGYAARMSDASEPGESPTQAWLDPAALRANFAEVRRLAGAREVIAVVKADAYGHGAKFAARALEQAGCARFAVATLDEGRALRRAGLRQPVLVLGGFRGDPQPLQQAGLTPVLQHATQFDALLECARRSAAPLALQVEVDTGMRRTGVACAEAEVLLARIAAEPALRLEGVYTHLARADEEDLAPSLAQLAEFRGLLARLAARGLRMPLIHFANSAGLLAGERLAAACPEANAVRPGLMLYGVSPAAHFAAQLAPVMSLVTRVAQIVSLAAGDAVGYGASWRAPRATRIATLAAGYADGIPFASSNRGCVWLGGAQRPIVGRVSMDFVAVEIGDAPVAPGDEALLFGRRGSAELPLVQVAAAAGTHAYECLVRVGARVPRSLVTPS